MPPRAHAAVLANSLSAVRILRRSGAERVISNGAGIALSFLPLARILGMSCHYIESAARVSGPSTTGRLLRASGTTHLYAQYQEWAAPPWSYRGSVFDNIRPVSSRCDGPIERVVVTLGTLHYRFDRLLSRLVDVLPPAAEVLWQVPTETPVRLPGLVVAALPPSELEAAMRAADVVVCHAGVGSALAALSAGKCPVLVPREAAFREHVDDHQVQVATLLGSRGLVITCGAGDLRAGHLAEAAALGAAVDDEPVPFVLSD